MYRVRFIAFVSFCALTLGAAFAEQKLKVTVSPGESSHYTSDMTLEALKAGTADYRVSGMGKTYRVKLTKQQIKDVLNGTTVMVDSSQNGGSGVRVNLSVEGEPESSGW